MNTLISITASICASLATLVLYRYITYRRKTRHKTQQEPKEEAKPKQPRFPPGGVVMKPP